VDMNQRIATPKVGGTLAMALALSACGGGGGVASTPTPPAAVAPTPTPTPTPIPTPTPSGAFNTAEYQRSNAAVQANAITAYNNGATGAGITVGVVDSGINPSSPEFAGRIHPASADVAGNRGLGDDDGHGTAVAAVLAGAKNDSGVHGLAFDSTILVARTDTPGSCATTTGPDPGCSHPDNAIARGVDLAVANRARVINISLGGSPANSTLRASIDRATAAGVIIVISAGNDGVSDPALAVNADPLALIANESVARGLVIIAGSVDAGNTSLSDFSNRAGTGAPHYISALGRRVQTIDQTGRAFFYTGTSFSAPVVAGAVALLAQAFPNLTSAQIVDLLFRSAIDLGDPGVDATFGYGALDIARAFQAQGRTVLVDSKIAVGLGAVVLDDYQRAYSVNLDGTLSRVGTTSRLASALGIGAQARRVSLGNAAVSLSVTRHGASALVEHQLLSPHDAQQSRAMAGAFVARLGPKTALAMGISQSGLALVDEMGRRPDAAFLVGRNAARDWGFDTRAGQSLAIRHQLGDWNLYAAAETGAARLWQGDYLARPGYRDHGLGSVSFGVGRTIGPLALSGRVTNLIERDTVLGASFNGFLGTNGARSWFADTQAQLDAGKGWMVSAAWRNGWTRVGPGGTRLGADHLRTSAWSFDVTKAGLFGRRDRFGVRVAQPLRVTRGGFNVHLPTSYDYATLTAGYADQRINLAPSGHETDIEAVWSVPLRNGTLSSNLYLRKQPGNIAAAPDDVGAAIRLTFGL
jgi:subtilisin family serine protease